MIFKQTTMSIQKPASTPAQQEKAARQVSAQFIEMMIKPMFTKHKELFGGDSWTGNSATSENLIEPMMVQHIASSMANTGDAIGLYPIFLKAIQQIDKKEPRSTS